MEYKQTHSTSSSSRHPVYVDLTDSPPPAKPLAQSIVNNRIAGSSTNPYSSYIKPAKAFHTPTSSKFSAPPKHVDGWPQWVQPKPKIVQPMDDREQFDLDAVKITAEDWQTHAGDAEAHMRELLSAAVGEADEEIKDGEDVVEGFADAVRLMPHQIRGVKWMRGRESGRKFGGILADDMGLGKTVQTLAVVVDGQPSATERKAGHVGTLIVAPLAVMEQWATEIRTKTRPGQLKVTTHHGPSRAKSAKKLDGYDVVITTYQTLASEHAQDQADSDSDKPRTGGALLQKKWYRIVLDEAHNIKNRNTKAAKAAVALKAKYRWCLTGTPIQNNVEELYSLFKFLKAKPLDNWDTFRDRIGKPVKAGQTKIAMKRLHVVLKAMMLRRAKDATLDGKPILVLPGRQVDIVPCIFDADEKAFYQALEQQTALTFNKFVKAGTVMANYTSVLVMLLRLRQACCHPTLVASSFEPAAAADGDADDLADMLGGLGMADEGAKCDICFASIDAGKRCEECQDVVDKIQQVHPSSAKIRTLVKLLKAVKSDEKTIVFSQFTSFLNLVEPFLKEEGIHFVRYDGKMRNDKRVAALEQIRSDPKVRVILISFKAGSTGLNLTCCNNVVLMDLWWNPALEDQAFDRAHRLGQTRDVNIFKLTVEETVEDRILKLQDGKRELAKAALSGTAIKNGMKLTLNDIMNLFKRSEHDVDSDED